MGEIVINRGAQKIDLFSLIPFVTVTKAEHVQDLLSTDRITLSIASSQPMLFYLGDYIVYGGRKFTLNLNPTLQKQAEDVYLYDMQFEGVQYDLLRKKYFNYDAQGFYTTGDFPLTGEINVFLLALINNANRDETDYTWILGYYPAGTETKTITFSNVNCLAALQTICQEFEQEFEIVQDMVAKTNTLYINKVGELRDYEFEYGYGNGLYSLKRDNVSEGQVITRLYPYGSTENIPTNYRNFSPRLRLPESYGKNYIQDNAKVALFGLVEEIKNYDDIKPTFKGIVSGVGTAVTAQNTFSVSIANMDFDLNEKKADGVSTKYLIDGTPAKIHVNKGNLAGYEFEIHKYTHSTKTFEIKVFADERGQKFPDLNTIFKFAIGDEITLLDIIMPDVYIINAENKLKDKALEDYDKLSQNNVKYSLDIDPMFFANIGGGTDVAHLTIGDYISVKDSALGIQKTSRVISLNRDLLANDGYKYSAEISDSYEISIVTQILQDIQDVQTQVGVVVVRNKEAMLAGYKRMKELQGLVFDPDGYFDPTNIKPNSIETNMLTVGAKSQQLSLESVIIKTNVNNDPNSVSITAGKLIHFSISDTGIKEWNLTAINKTLPTNEAYYIYARVPRAGTTGTFNIVTSKLKFDSEDLYYNFLVAVVFSPQNGIRLTELMYGSTFIHGRTITTGRIQSVDGLTWFDLDTGQIKGKIEFLPDSPAFQQVSNSIVIGGRNFALGTKTAKSTTLGWIIYPISQEMVSGDYFLAFDYNTKATNGIGISLGSNAGYDGSYEYTGDLSVGQGKFSQKITFVRTNQTHLTIYVNAQTEIKNLKLEKGTKGTDWTVAPEDVEEQISIAENTAIVANQLLADIANDNKLTASEKQSLKKEYDIIIAEKPQIQEQANIYGVSTTAYINAYNALIIYTNPLLVNLNTTDDIVGSVLRNTFNNYYTAKVNLLKAITDLSYYSIENVYEEIEELSESVNSEIADVQNSVSDLNNYVDGAFSDGIISAAEAVAIEKYINQINTEKSDIDNKYNQIYNDYYLTGTPKNNLATDYNNYVSAHTNLINSINTAISDGATTPAEKSDVDSKFSSYRLALGGLTTRFQEAIKAIETATVNAIQVGGRNFLKNSKNFEALTSWGKNANVVVTNSADYITLDFPSSTANTGIFQSLDLGGYSGDITISFDAMGTQNGWNADLNIGIEGKAVKTAFGINDVLTWTRFSFTLNLSTATNACTFIFYKGGNAISLGIRLKNIKLEKGNKATDWSPAPEDVQDDINIAQSTANNAIVLLTDLGSDNKLTASEKQTTLNEWNRIKSEYLQNYNQASALLLSVTSYQSAYNALNTYITPLLVDLSSTSTIDGVVFRQTFKNYYDQNVAIVAAIGNKQIENVQVGGRNFFLNSNFSKNLTNWNTSGTGSIIPDNVLRQCRIDTTGSGGIYQQLNLANYSGNLTISFEYKPLYMSGWDFLFGIEGISTKTIQLGNDGSKWVKYEHSFSVANQSNSTFIFYAIGSGQKNLLIRNLKLEKGNKATDWMPAPEDVDADITTANTNSANALAQAQNAMNTASATAAVTSFMQTTVDGNVVSTGTLQVGDVNGANAMISGVTDKPNGESIRFAAGQNYSNKYRSPFQVLDNGMLLFVNPLTGKTVFELGFNQAVGKVVFNIYDDDGNKIIELGSQGIIFNNYISDSWNPVDYFLIPAAYTTSNAAMSQYIHDNLKFTDYKDTPYGNYASITVDKTSNYWRYLAGRSYDSQNYVQYENFYYATDNNNNKPTPSVAKLADGWYTNIFQAKTEDTPSIVAQYNFTVSAFKIVNGELNQVLSLTITGSHRIRP